MDKMLDELLEWDDLFYLDVDVGEGLRVPEEFLYGPMTAHTAALRYTDPLRHENYDWRDLFQIGYHFIFTAVQLPEVQHRLVELLVEIKSTPHALYNKQAGQTEILKWEDLPVFREVLGGFWRHFDRSCSNPDISNFDKWIEFNNFAARLTEARVIDCSKFGISALQVALEIPVSLNADTTREYNRMIRVINAKVRIVAHWMYYASPVLFEYAYKQEMDHFSIGAPRERIVGFSWERWDVWKFSFMHMARLEYLNPGTRRVAKDAWSEMQRFEKEEIWKPIPILKFDIE